VKDVSHLVWQRLPALTVEETMERARAFGLDPNEAAEGSRIERWEVGATTVTVYPEQPDEFCISCHGRFPTTEEILVVAERLLPGHNVLAAPTPNSGIGGQRIFLVWPNSEAE
jgi:hypothetical protein